MDRRALFFVIAAVVCFVLVPLSDAEFRWVPEATGVTYVVLAGLSALDHWSRSRS